MSNGFPEPNVELASQIQEFYDSLPEVQHEGHTGQIDDVMTAIEAGTPVLIDGISGRNTLELIIGIYKSATTGEKVLFPLQPDDLYYTREGIQTNVTHFYEKNASVENFQDLTITTGSNLSN